MFSLLFANEKEEITDLILLELSESVYFAKLGTNQSLVRPNLVSHLHTLISTCMWSIILVPWSPGVIKRSMLQH